MASFDRFAFWYTPFMRLLGPHERYARNIRKAGRLRRDQRVLDLGGGSGLMAERLAPYVREIVILDPSRKMLAQANVRTRVGVAQRIPYPAGSFDVVLCVDSFHHFSNGSKDKERAMRAAAKEMLRVLKPRGRLLILEFDMGTRWGRMIRFFENSLMRWGSSFFTREEFRAFFAQHRVRILENDPASFIACVTNGTGRI